MLQMEYVQMAQNSYFEKQAAKILNAKRIADHKRQINRRITVAMTLMIVAIMVVTFFPKVKALVPAEQDYIVRYGRAWNWGNQVQMNDDNSIWNVIDPPEFAEGTDVRVLVSTNGTATDEDDTIIDITPAR